MPTNIGPIDTSNLCRTNWWLAYGCQLSQCRTYWQVAPIDWHLELNWSITEFYVDSNFAIGPIDRQLELDQGVTEFYVDANLAIRPIDWQLWLLQGITEFYVDANFANEPIDWQFKVDSDVTEFNVDANFAIRLIDWRLAVWCKPGWPKNCKRNILRVFFMTDLIIIYGDYW